MREGLHNVGCAEGKSIVIEFRWPIHVRIFTPASRSVDVVDHYNNGDDLQN
jgi:hypothetical protein